MLLLQQSEQTEAQEKLRHHRFPLFSLCLAITAFTTILLCNFLLCIKIKCNTCKFSAQR